jgi:hypothetical protein
MRPSFRHALGRTWRIPYKTVRRHSLMGKGHQIPKLG